jgi:hypothetical protein
MSFCRSSDINYQLHHRILSHVHSSGNLGNAVDKTNKNVNILIYELELFNNSYDNSVY